MLGRVKQDTYNLGEQFYSFSTYLDKTWHWIKMRLNKTYIANSSLHNSFLFPVFWMLKAQGFIK